MNKTTLTLGLVTLAVLASLGYQRISGESSAIVSNPASSAELGNEQSLTSQKLASPVVAELAVSPRESDRDMQRMPRQVSDPIRALGSGPRAGEDYAHHPRSGSEQSITAPVIRPAPEPTPVN